MKLTRYIVAKSNMQKSKAILVLTRWSRGSMGSGRSAITYWKRLIAPDAFAFISTTYSGNVARGTRCLVFHERHIAGSSILTTLEILYRATGMLYFVWCIPSSFLFTFLSLWNIFLNFFLTLEPPRLIKKISKIISQRI